MGQSNTHTHPLPQRKYPRPLAISGGIQAGAHTFFCAMQRLFPKHDKPFEYSDEDLEKDLQTISCDILKNLFSILNQDPYEKNYSLKQALINEFNLQDSPLYSVELSSLINSTPNCKLVLLKMWKYFGLKELYETYWIEAFNNSYLGDNLDQLIENIAKPRKNFYPNSLITSNQSYPRKSITNYYNESFAFLQLYECNYRKCLIQLNPEAVICFFSLSDFDQLGDNFNRMTESVGKVDSLIYYTKKKFKNCKIILIFTKPDLLIRKLKRIKYYKELDHNIRTELEVIEDENVKLSINSIISYYFEAMRFQIDSYHIVNLTLDSEIRQVCHLIFRENNFYF